MDKDDGRERWWVDYEALKEGRLGVVVEGLGGETIRSETAEREGKKDEEREKWREGKNKIKMKKGGIRKKEEKGVDNIEMSPHPFSTSISHSHYLSPFSLPSHSIFMSIKCQLPSNYHEEGIYKVFTNIQNLNKVLLVFVSRHASRFLRIQERAYCNYN